MIVVGTRQRMLLATLPCVVMLYGCVGGPTPARQLEANKAIVRAYFRPGITPAEREALVAPDYIQHNPTFRRYAEAHGLSDRAALAQLMGRRPVVDVPAGVVPPPPSESNYILMADKDLVTVVRRDWLPLPAGEPGRYYERFWWDAYRLRGGRIVEHWDGDVLRPIPEATAK